MKCLAIVVPMLVVLAGCSAGDSGKSGAAAPVARVTLARAVTGDIAQSVTVYGEIGRGGASPIVLAAPFEAVVITIETPAGTSVKAGALIARLRPSPASLAQAQAASADAVAAERGLARAQRLRSDGLASDADVEAARSRATSASALRDAFDTRTSALTLRAPLAGFVDAIGASAGELVQPGVAVATLSRAGAVKARFGIDPALARGLRDGGLIEIRPGDGSPPFAARIDSISPVAAAQTLLASMLVDIPADKGLAAGQPLSARVVTRATQASVGVPYAALLDDGGQPYVFVVKDGVAHRRDVVVGASDGTRAAILKGVVAGEPVVIAGATAVEDGMKVRTK